MNRRSYATARRLRDILVAPCIREKHRDDAGVYLMSENRQRIVLYEDSNRHCLFCRPSRKRAGAKRIGALAKSRRASASRSRDTCAPRAAGRRRIRLSIDPVRPEPMSGTLRRARATRATRVTRAAVAVGASRVATALPPSGRSTIPSPLADTLDKPSAAMNH
ncbi:hypothetical protein [Burkholderia pseudomallei]|uniref:hypothetical protein n=1 Tax=Burkholderia pseudomallei TaxID=28450 RepID=UPI0012AED7C8|nr:hypothetical protein [Burkholderia pseudomallei]